MSEPDYDEYTDDYYEYEMEMALLAAYNQEMEEEREAEYDAWSLPSRRSMMRVATPEEPYNRDPLDQPIPGDKKGDTADFLNALEQELRVNPPEPLVWDQIRAQARVEWEARLTEFNSQKNSVMVNYMLDFPQGNHLPDDLLAQTQVFTRETHPLEVKNYDGN